MNAIRNPDPLEHLVERLNALRPDSPRRWGTLTAAEMLCHLGDSTASVLDRGAAERAGEPIRRRKNHRFMKWVALRTSVAWPQGKLPTPRNVDPHRDGTKPGDFDADRRRAIEGLRAFAAAPPEAFAATHGAFGRMSADDWRRWAYRHTDHHLRQFGV